MNALNKSLLGLGCALGFAPGVLAQSYSIDWFTIDGGGGTSTGGVYSVTGTIGQPDAGGLMSGGNYTLQGGFWSIQAVQTPGGANPRRAVAFHRPNRNQHRARLLAFALDRLPVAAEHQQYRLRELEQHAGNDSGQRHHEDADHQSANGQSLLPADQAVALLEAGLSLCVELRAGQNATSPATRI
jgi:hypothetical protein